MAEASIPTHRNCTKCLKVKPLEAFHRQRLGKHGRTSTCRECKSPRGGIDAYLAQAILQESPERGWRPVLGWEGLYSASEDGKIRSEDRTVYSGQGRERLHRGQVLKAQLGQNGYYTVRLSGNGRSLTKTVHSLVAEAFLGTRPQGQDVAHNDGDRSNNAIANLRWATRAENCSDKMQHGTDGRGEYHSQARLTWEKVAYIRTETGLTAAELAQRFGVNRTTIDAVRSGRSWILAPTQKARRQNPANRIPASIKRDVHRRGAGKCYYCGQKCQQAHVDHIVPRSRGGTNDPENLLIACRSCNLRKQAKLPWEFETPRLL